MYMNIEIKNFEELSNLELFEIFKSRVAIFVVEQNCPYQEIDDIDLISEHIFIKDDKGKILSYLRLFKKDDRTMQIGRVVSTVRGKGYAGLVLHEAVERAKKMPNIHEIYLEAQTYAIGFYGKEGFSPYGEEFLEDGIPHIKMKLSF